MGRRRRAIIAAKRGYPPAPRSPLLAAPVLTICEDCGGPVGDPYMVMCGPCYAADLARVANGPLDGYEEAYGPERSN